MTLLKKTNSQSHNIISLSVQVSLIGHSFLVKDVAMNKEIFSHNETFATAISPDEALIALTTTIEENPELQQKFETITVVHQNDLLTVVPQSLFDENEAANYLKFNTKILPTDFVAFDVLAQQELIVVYVPYININNYFFDTYGSFQYYHHATIAIKEAISSSSFKEATNVHVDVLKNSFSCTVIEKGKLLLHNVYSYKTKEDFIYYILFCFEQLALNPDETPLILSGIITTDSELHQLLYTYIRNITTINISTSKNTETNASPYYLLSNATL